MPGLLLTAEEQWKWTPKLGCHWGPCQGKGQKRQWSSALPLARWGLRQPGQACPGHLESCQADLNQEPAPSPGHHPWALPSRLLSKNSTHFLMVTAEHFLSRVLAMSTACKITHLHP